METNRKTKSVSTENEEQIINNLKHYQKPVLVSDAPKESAVLGFFLEIFLLYPKTNGLLGSTRNIDQCEVINHYLRMEMPVPMQEYDSCYPFVWYIWSFNFAILITDFSFDVRYFCYFTFYYPIQRFFQSYF